MRTRRWIPGALVVALSACGGGSGTSTSTSTSTSASTIPADPLAVRPESAASSQLPDVVVRQVQTGDSVQLKNLLPSTKPLLVWFWAPH